ncbi:MAG: hypothetical protein LKG27_05920 [Clostridiaceae bacterium]|jgi:hypothetical protein|nr:hypothetical protein [Clostridiaceae bacterium]
MKKFLIIMMAMFIGLQVAQAKPSQVKNNVKTTAIEQEEKTPVLKLSATFDWANMTQVQRDEKVQAYYNKLFDTKKSSAMSKKEFKTQYKNFLKDENHREHYRQAKNGVTELEDSYLCAFYAKKDKDLVIIYALQYKNDMKHAYYYDAYGNLRYVDVMSDEYPNFPYYSKQFYRNGKLISAIAFENRDTQYMYNPDGTFKGLWYKEKMFNQKGKQLITRTNW